MVQELYFQKFLHGIRAKITKEEKNSKLSLQIDGYIVQGRSRRSYVQTPYGARRIPVGRSMSQWLVIEKGFVIIDIGILRRREIYQKDIETQRESSFRGRNPMEASTSGSGEIRLIITLVTTTMQKQQQSSQNNSMIQSYLSNACKSLRSKEKVRDLVVERSMDYLSIRNLNNLWSSQNWRSREETGWRHPINKRLLVGGKF